MSNGKKTMDLQKLVQHPSSLKLLILHTPFTLDISSLWRCTNLIKLDLSKNNLSSFPYIGNLSNLKFMFLHQNKLDMNTLKGIFYSEHQPLYSPLSKSIVWVTFWGNKNAFLARHFLVSQTSVIAVDHNMVVPEEKKQSVLPNDIQPFSQSTDLSPILDRENILNKNASEEEYMEQFWEEMRQLRKKMQQISPIIKIQKLYRGWILRKSVRDKKINAVCSVQLKSKVLKGWRMQILRQKKLGTFLQKRNKQHYLLPLHEMKLQIIKQKMLQWAARSKQRVLFRKISLKKEVRFYEILRSNMLMFRSMYNEMQLEKSRFLIINSQNFRDIQHKVKQFIRVFNNQDVFQVSQNNKYIVRQVEEGSIRKQFSRFLIMNQRSYVIKINYAKKSKFPLSRSLLNQNICFLPTFSTEMKTLFKNQNKVHFSNVERTQMNRFGTQLEKRQKLMLQEYKVITGSTRILKDFLRCVYYINTETIKVNQGKFGKIKIFSQKSINKLCAIVIIQKFWRGFIFRKKQKQNAQLCAKQFRAAVKIQRWVRKLPLKKKYLFRKLMIPIIKSIKDPFFVMEMNDYLRTIQTVEDPTTNHTNRMKFIEQNLTPYFNITTKKITLFWNPEEQSSQKFVETAKACFQIKKSPFDRFFVQTLFKHVDPKQIFYNPLSSQIPENEDFEKGQFSHLFHFNTLTSLASKQNKFWIKISCNSVEQTKVRVLGILLKSFSFKNGLATNIYPNQIIDFNKYFVKNILNSQSIFVTKGDVVIKQNSSNIKKFTFKSKVYLMENNSTKPNKFQQKLMIFAHNFDDDPILESQFQKHDSQIEEQFKKPKKRQKIYIDQMYFSQSGTLQKSQTEELLPKHIKIEKEKFMSHEMISKADLMPTALKKILPLKRQIKSYKVQKRIKKREPSFMLDSSTKPERVVTLPDLNIQEPSQASKSDKSLMQLMQDTNAKQKIKKNYIYRKELIKSHKEENSFHQNFINLNNFIQQQSISEHRRKIKTQIQISAYESADNVRSSLGKSSEHCAQIKQDKMRRVQLDIKNHKDILEKHRAMKEKQKDELQRLKSIERQRRLKDHQQVRRLKVSFAEECYPIANRSYNHERTQSQSIQKAREPKPSAKKYQIQTISR